MVKEAAGGINSKIRTFRANYTHQDDVDIALMACLDIMTEYLRYKAGKEEEANEAMESLTRLEKELDNAMGTNPSTS